MTLKNKYIKVLGVSFFVMAIVLYAYLLSLVLSSQNTYMPIKSDAIIVLGHSIDANNSTPEKWLVERLESALDLYNKGYADKIIVSGGKGPKDNIAVAIAMQAWLLDNGVQDESIFIEDKSSNTDENFKFCKIIADENNIKSIIVVTNDFHMYRSIMIAKHYFTDISGYSAAVDFDINKFFAYLKEPLSIVKYGLILILF